ncbi:MAG: prepilin-type N-terminal cleavage/methylation domain-containing protein [Methylococcaceae bacterium]|nr:prepilin-type N-terminal cleavage/methylation domain-containing protein [Methylococcaceae bacterium]
MIGAPFKPDQAGFTLLEVMIATVLLAIVMTLLLGGMRVGAGSWERGESQAEQTSSLLVADNFFRSHLSDVLPLFESPTDPGQAGFAPHLLFRGGVHELEYAGTLPPQVRGGMYKFRLYLAAEGGRSDLKLAIRPFSTGSPGDSQAIEDVRILENVESLRISYYRKINAEADGQWIEEWKEDFLPSLVKLEIALIGVPEWPAIIVVPRAETGR